MAKHYQNIIDEILDTMSFDKVAQLDDVDYFNGSTHTAGGESAGFSWNEETGDVVEGNLPEVGEAHSELEDHTGIERPATKLPTEVGKTTVASLKTAGGFTQVFKGEEDFTDDETASVYAKARQAVEASNFPAYL